MNIYKKLTRKCWRIHKQNSNGAANRPNVSLWYIIKELFKHDSTQNYSINIL